MNQINQTLAYLHKTYDPFTRFNHVMLTKIQDDGLRIFTLYAGEELTIRTQAKRDFLYLTEGSAMFKSLHHDKIYHLKASDIDIKPIPFREKDSPIVIKALQDVTICHADMKKINNVVSFQELSENEKYFHRLCCLERSQLCRSLPVDTIQTLAKSCEEIQVKKDTEVVTQYEPANAFYIILTGQAEVIQEDNSTGNKKVVALLSSGATFGERGLILGEGRDATVKMTRNGKLLKLYKHDFDNLVSKAIVHRTSPQSAENMIVKMGIELIDVRFKEEYEENFIPGSRLIPLSDLRRHIANLDAKKEYLIISATDQPAIAATVILKQYGITASVIEGGIEQWPYNTIKKHKLELFSLNNQDDAECTHIALRHNNIEYTHTILDSNNLPEWYFTSCSQTRTPILKIDEKTIISGQLAINQLIAQISENDILPHDPVTRSQHIDLMHDGITLLNNFRHLISHDETNQSELENIINGLQKLESDIADDHYVASSNQLCLLDITYAPLLVRLKHRDLDQIHINEQTFPNLMRWRQKLLNHEDVRAAIPETYRSYTKIITTAKKEAAPPNISKKTQQLQFPTAPNALDLHQWGNIGRNTDHQ